MQYLLLSVKEFFDYPALCALGQNAEQNETGVAVLVVDKFWVAFSGRFVNEFCERSCAHRFSHKLFGYGKEVFCLSFIQGGGIRKRLCCRKRAVAKGRLYCARADYHYFLSK